MYAVLQGMQWVVIGSQRKQCYSTGLVKLGGGRKSRCLEVLRNKTTPEREGTAKYWKGEHKGKEKQEEKIKIDREKKRAGKEKIDG